MPDPIQPTPSVQPTTPVAPTLPNPQDVVDAALSNDISTPKTEMAEAPKTETLPPLPPLTPTEPPVVAPPTAPMPTPEPMTPSIGTSNVVMGDDTPLAFAGASIPPASPATQSPLESPIPPVAPPVPPVAPARKKKGKLGKIMVGIGVLVLTIVGGVYGYYKTFKTTPQIANLSEMYACTGSGGTWSSAGCKYNNVVKPIPGNTTPPNDNNDDEDNLCPSGTTVPGSCQTTVDGRVCKGKQTRTCNPANGSYSGWSSCVIDNSTCVVVGSGGEDDGDACTTTDGKSGIRYSGVCVAPSTCTGNCPTACTGNYQNAGGSLVQEPGRSYCNPEGKYCQVTRIEWSSNGTNTGTHCFVTQTEDCSGSCDGGSPPPSTPPSTPTMKCDGLTSIPTTTPTAPTIGTKLTFTCAGTVTPSTAGTLSYKFRYSINSGTPVDITPLTATPNKAELTINACGTYSVQCQACATISGVLTCNPTWTAATQ